MPRSLAGPRARVRACLVVLLLALPLLGACSTSRIGFPYPQEAGGLVYGGKGAPRVLLGQVEDVRPQEQQEGQGHFGTITFPKRRALLRPMVDLYRDALAQDLASTEVVTLVPSAAQAGFVLSAEIFNLDCRQIRSPGVFVLPAAAGLTAGLATGKTSSDRLKSGIVIGFALMLAVPMPARLQAESEVRLTLRDMEGRTVWQQTCKGEIAEQVYLPVTAREDKKYAEKYLPRAVKRCNACLLGELTRFFAGRQPAASK
jgi:hypothetical protein